MRHARTVDMRGVNGHFAVGDLRDIAFRHGNVPHRIIAQRAAVAFAVQGDGNGVAWITLAHIAGHHGGVAMLVIADGVIDGDRVDGDRLVRCRRRARRGVILLIAG